MQSYFDQGTEMKKRLYFTFIYKVKYQSLSKHLQQLLAVLMNMRSVNVHGKELLKQISWQKGIIRVDHPLPPQKKNIK